MAYVSLYKTVTGNGLLAHIYEHLLAQDIMRSPQNKGFFVLSDMTLTAKTYGDSCFMDAQLCSSTAQETYEEALQLFDSKSISKATALRAVYECGIEMSRPVVDAKPDELLRSLGTIQSSAWRQQIDLTYHKAYDESSVNTQFSISCVTYGEPSDKLFADHVLEYSVDEQYIRSPIDQALAAIVMQAAALNFLVAIREKYTIYDRGDQWSEASKSVGYRMFLGASAKDRGLADACMHDFLAYRQRLLISSFCENLRAALVRQSHTPNQLLIDRDQLNDILGGCIIGGKGWAGMADVANIRRLLSAIELDSYRI